MRPTLARNPLPLPACPDCQRPQRGPGVACVCGWTPAPADPFTFDPYTAAVGLAGVAEARRQLRVARALRKLAADTTVDDAAGVKVA